MQRPVWTGRPSEERDVIRILVADDNPTARRFLRGVLEQQEGWQVSDEARNGQEAVERFRKNRHDLVVVDFQMPEMNGLDAARVISGISPGTPILMVTLHLGNYTLRNWAWRAPLFAVFESGTEIVASLALTALNLEPLGAVKAELSDWLPTATRILTWRLLGISLFALVLAVVVSVVRRVLLAAEDRTHTARRIHRASAEHASVEEP